MADCKLIYKDNTPVGVEKDNGQESSLFKDIFNHPTTDSFEEALDIYKNTKSKKFTATNEGDSSSETRKPTLDQKEDNYSYWHRTEEGTHASYAEALKTGSKEIEIGFFSNSGTFTPIKTVRPNFDETTKKGFINSFIKQGILSPHRKDIMGVSYFQPNGYSQAAQGINSMVLREQALVNLGWTGFNKTKNGFTFDPKEIDKLIGNEALLEQEIKTILERNSTLRDKQPPNSRLDEGELKLRLLDLLNSLGVDVLSISDYVSKYKTKNGTEPGVKALADIANKIVAFQGGEITIEELTEEVAHFIVEGWDQSQIENLLRNIHKTSEWNQFVEEYRTLYSSRYKGEELDQAVRREILGKVLANSLANNYNTEEKTTTQVSIINKLKELFTDFINSVRSLINQKTINDLDNFTEQINDLLYENKLSEYLNQENYEGNSFVLYSANNANTEIKGMRADVIQALNIARQNIQKFTKGTNINAADKISIDRNIKKLQELSESADKVAQKQTVVELLAIVSNQVNELNAIIKQSNNGERLVYGAEENARFESLTKELKPVLGTIKENIRANPKDFKKKDWKKVINNITHVQQEISDTEGRMQHVLKDVIEKDMVNQIMQQHNFDEGYRNHVEAWLEAAKKDTSLFHRHFGQITNSRDPLLGLASNVGERVTNGSNREFVHNIKEFQNKLEALGVKPQEFKKFFNNGYLIDEIDHAALEKKVQDLRATARLWATGEVNRGDKPTEDQIKEVIKKQKDKTIEELDSDQSALFDNYLEQELLKIQERPFTEQYYKDRDEKYENLKITAETQKQIKAYSTTRFGLTMKARREDGKVDWARLSLAEEEQLHALNRRRKKDASVTNSDGSLKTGIIETTNEAEVPATSKKEKTAVKVKDVWYYIDSSKTNTTEARIAIDLIKLDNQYRKDLEEEGAPNKEVPDTFIYEVIDIEATQGKEAALRFIEANTSINFSQEFWDQLSGGESYLDRVESAAKNLEVDKELEVLEITSDIKKLNNKRSNTLKQYRRQGKAYETDATKMGPIPKEAIRELDESIQGKYNELSNKIKLDQEEVQGDPIHQNEPNEAYLKEVEEEDMDFDEELDFIYNNSTASSRDRVARFRRGISRYLTGEEKAITPSQAEFVKSINFIPDNSGSNMEQSLTIAYARTQLSSYYKKLIPKEATSVFETKEKTTATEYLNNLIAAEYIEVQPNYSYLEQNNKYENKNFDSNYEGGIQPKRGGEFESKKYKEMFAPNAKGEATKNKKLFDALQELKELQRSTLENYNLTGKHSLFKIPQTTKKGVDRSIDFIKRMGKGGIKQGLLELGQYRVEDVAYGENITGENIRTIPTYYTADVQNEEELTDELFYSYALMYQQSTLHKHRRNGVGEMLAIKDAIGKRDQPKGKSAETTNTIRMFKNYMDYAIFGVQESQEFKVNVFGQEIDLTKIARVLLDFVKFRNLAFSPIVAATSWLTGEVNFQIEKKVRQIINPDSERLGRKAFYKLASDAMKEVGEQQSKSKLNTLGEFFGIYELSSRFEGSNYNWTSRNIANIQKLGFSLHQMANFPISPRAMLAVMHDYRIIDSKQIYNFAQYKVKRKTENSALTTKEIEEEWKAFESDVLYNYIEVQDGNVSFNDGIKSKLDESLNKDEYLTTKMGALTKSVKNAVTQLDQQITSTQRTAAQRHFAMNYLMTHRSWLSIALSNRTKNAHYNLNSGEHEEGSYRSFFHVVQEAIVGFAKHKNKRILKDLWEGKDLEPDGEVSFARLLETRQRNLRRVMLDTVWIMGIGAIGYALMAYTDDDDDNYAAQLTSYLTLRTLNEVASSSTALPLQFFEVLKSPFVGLNTLKDLVTLAPNAINSETVKSGAFKGYSSFEKNLIEVLPGMNVAQDILNIKDTKDTYWYYNNSNVRWSPTLLLDVMFNEQE